MSELIKDCPFCHGELKAVCSVTVTYTITGGGQDWDRHADTDAIDDNSSELQYVECDSCGRTWQKGRVTLDSQGLLVGLDGNGGIPVGDI